MLSEVEKELGRVAYEQERNLLATLDKFFEDPSDENLAAMQSLRHDHKESVEALNKARRARRDQEKAAETMSKATAAYTASVKPLAAVEVERRMEELRKKAEARIEELRALEEERNTKARELERREKSIWGRLFG